MTEGEKNRVLTLANDHDFEAEATLTPVGIFLPQLNQLYLFLVESKVTADCLVDILEQWWQMVKPLFPHIRKLVINGPHCGLVRTVWLLLYPG